MKIKVILLCSLISFILVGCSKSDNDFTSEISDPIEYSVDNWTSYCGWHYNNGTVPNWAGWTREYAKDKFGLFISDTINYQIDVVALENSYQELLSLDLDIDILQLDGGLGSAKDTTRVKNWMQMIEADNAYKWKQIVYAQSKKLTQIPNAEERVYWQIGNEISSPSYSQTIRYWQGEPYSNGYNYDTFIIPYYVENYLAPTIEAIEMASTDVYGETGKINICLGSLTNATSLAAQSFLSTLLNYEIVGNNAATLTGKKVSDLIHLITIHYTMGTAKTSEWESVFTTYKNWSGTGRIKGVWSSEEVGINAALGGAGSVIGSIATSRCLEWSINNQYSAKEARVNYYGWNTGDASTTVNDFNQFLFDALGNRKISNVNKLATTIDATNNVEFHSFKSEIENKKVIIVFPEREQNQLGSQINEVILDETIWGGIQNITAYKYDNQGINEVITSLNQTENTTELTFNSQLTLDYFSGLVLLIED
ncbi:hypothetical protein [uncultured Winogradskyella sp.]|uniref:hypothetical protein n=1 Tax=Olleya sp. TaxID=1906788 RepID=UPI0030EEDB8F